jgi:hypothetical protein
MAGTDVPHAAAFEAAARAVRRARRQRVDERGAFDQFCKRVERLSTGGDQPDMAPDPNCAVVSRHETDTAGSGAVRDAYESTVMVVPHYWDVYDDCFSEHFAMELGHDLLADLQRAGRLTPALQQRIVDTAATAHQRRIDAIEILDDERLALEEARQALGDVADALSGAGSPDAVSAGRTEAVRERCVAVRRQRRAHLAAHDLVRETEPAWVSSAAAAVRPRLSTMYAELSVRDPVLAAIDQLTAQLPETGVDADPVSSTRVESDR